MTAEVFESSLELNVETLEPVPPEFGTCGPFQKLRQTGAFEKRSFHTVALQNSFMRVDVVTELGGRIGRILDRRTGVAVLDLGDSPELLSGGCRGVEMPSGISVTFDGTGRPNDLGRVDWLIEPADNDGLVGLWIGENACGPIGMHVHFTLPPDAAELALEARIFNRSGQAVHYNGGLRIGSGRPCVARYGALLDWDEADGKGVCLWSQELLGRRADLPLYVRFGPRKSMAPGQLDTWKVSLMPVTGLAGRPFPSPGAVASIGMDHLELATSREQVNCKLVVLTQTEEGSSTLEARIDLQALEPWRIPLSAIKGEPKEFRVLNSDRETLMALETSEEWDPNLAHIGDCEALEAFPDSWRAVLRREGFKWSWRATTELLHAKHNLGGGSFAEADRLLEQSLLYNGEDHLTWWLKAAANRHLNREGENPELLNAHYLAPLEPALRAEAFLEQPIAMSAEPNPLLRPFDDNPMNFVEVAALLIDAGLLADAARWIDEAVRHVDLAMLHYLQAYCHLAGSKLEIEASHHMGLAAKLPFAAPFPFRRIELIALEKLKERFSKDEQLERYRRIAIL